MKSIHTCCKCGDHGGVAPIALCRLDVHCVGRCYQLFSSSENVSVFVKGASVRKDARISSVEFRNSCSKCTNWLSFLVIFKGQSGG